MRIWSFVISAFAVIFLVGCLSTAPVTGRTQLVLMSADQEKSLGLSEAETILKEANQTADKALANMVTAIATRIVAASDDAKQYEWSF